MNRISRTGMSGFIAGMIAMLASACDGGQAADEQSAIDASTGGPDSPTSDPVAALAQDPRFAAAYAAYEQRMTNDGFYDARCRGITSASARPPTIGGTYEVPECAHQLSADGSHAIPCSAAFSLGAQDALDAITDTVNWTNTTSLVPSGGPAFARGDSQAIGVWFARTQDVAELNCSLTTINFVDILPNQPFVCAFSAVVDGECPGVPSWWSWQGRVTSAGS